MARNKYSLLTYLLIYLKRSNWSPVATAKRGHTKDVARAPVTRRSEPGRIVDRRGEDTSGTANRRDRRNHEDAINDAVDVSGIIYKQLYN